MAAWENYLFGAIALAVGGYVVIYWVLPQLNNMKFGGVSEEQYKDLIKKREKGVETMEDYIKKVTDAIKSGKNLEASRNDSPVEAIKKVVSPQLKTRDDLSGFIGSLQKSIGKSGGSSKSPQTPDELFRYLYG